MPGNILNADTGFPTFAEGEDSNAKIDKVMNYLYMLLEQLRYSLANLDADNFNDAGLKEIADGIARPLQTSFENELVKTSALIEGWSNEFGSQITLLTQFRKTVEDGTIESIARIDQKADENAASIKLLTDWKGETSESLAALEILASQNESKISLLTQWQGTVDDEIEGLVATTAVIGIQADENSAAIESLAQFRKTVEDGSISSIAGIKQQADANSSSISLIAEWQKTVEDGSISSIASIDAKADANSAQITQLNQWKGTASSSIAAVQTLASQNGAKITSLTNWRSTVEDDLEGLSSSVAYIEELADENGASISQIVRAVGKNGEVSAASIVAAVNKAGSTVKINADHVDITGFVTYESLENDGEAYINGNNIGLVSDSDGDSTASLRFWLEDDINADEDDYLIGEIYTSGTDNYLEDCTLHIKTSTSKMKITSGGDLDMSSALAVSIESGTSYVEIIADGSLEMYSGDDAIVDCRYMTIIPSRSGSSSRYVDYAWQFFDDGIYYNGYKMVSTPS